MDGRNAGAGGVTWEASRRLRHLWPGCRSRSFRPCSAWVGGRAVKGGYRGWRWGGWRRFAGRSWSMPGVAAAGLGCLQAADEGVEAGGESFVAVV